MLYICGNFYKSLIVKLIPFSIDVEYFQPLLFATEQSNIFLESNHDLLIYFIFKFMFNCFIITFAYFKIVNSF